MILELPFPPKELSQNARIHHYARARAVKAYRQECMVLARTANLKIDWAGDIHLWIDFYRPNRHHYDDDGLSGRFKAGRDGIADALGVDDNRFRQHPYLKDEVCKGGKVVVRFSQGNF
jgi:Holliday junction resolvase RusA-like endonuclease